MRGVDEMQKTGVSLAEIQEAPKESLTLLVGPPGAGKSAFCHRMVLSGLATERPIIFVTTEQSPSAIAQLLSDRGMGEPTPAGLTFVDAFAQTVGLATRERPDTIGANCEDLNSINMAIAKLQREIGRRDILLGFDSLTSPYLFNREEMFRFMRLSLLKFAAEGNSVVALVDEGCGREEDLVAMMSIADGVIKMETEEDRQLLSVVKHPKVKPTRIQVPIEPKATIKSTFDVFKSTIHIDPSRTRQFMRSMSGKDETALRGEVGDFVNLFWPNLAHWSGMLWDPKRLPGMIYELNKEDGAFSTSREMRPFLPWRERLWVSLAPAFRALRFLPKNWSKVKDMKKLGGGPWDIAARWERSGIMEYLDEVSKTDEHYFRIHESTDCWGFENVGAAMASHLPPHMAGWLRGFERDGRDWNAVETKCIGLGDPYCEFKLVPGEIRELRSCLEKDSSVVERIHERLMDRLMGFLLHEKPLVDRPGLGSDVHLHVVAHAFGFPYLALAGERYRMAMRMGGARAGKKVGERLMDAGLSKDEAVRRMLRFLEHCKVGMVNIDETIRIRENCESLATGLFMASEGPSCYFTTGFLNGLFSAVKNQHVSEIRCIAAGDPYCEWEII
jgi:predicted hydrocarbon binding protein/KaiC/GvpD/RAD55 family RecA-like ATPase